MEYRDLVYWLQGFFELSKTNEITKEQLNVIRNHVNLTLVHNTKPQLIIEEKPEVPVNISESKIHDFEEKIKKAIIRC